MKVGLAGAFDNLGSDILKQLIKGGNGVVALDMKEKHIPEIKGKYEFHAIDVTKPETLIGTCDGSDVVITAVGLVDSSKTLSNFAEI